MTQENFVFVNEVRRRTVCRTKPFRWRLKTGLP